MSPRSVDVPCIATGHLPLSAYCVVEWVLLPALSTLFTGGFGS